LLIFLAGIMVFSRGFRHMGLFFLPLFCAFPFLVMAGIMALFVARHWWYGTYPKRKHGDPSDSHYRHRDYSDIYYDDEYYGEKPKRGDDSEIFYV
jgi:hypothetical protein